MDRSKLIVESNCADVGILLLSRQFHEPMAGASVKPFEYLACGLALLVTDTAEWEEMYVQPGYALSANPDSPESIAAAVRNFLDEPGLAQRMGEAGRNRIRTEWNYETQFAPVQELLEGIVVRGRPRRPSP